MLVFAHTVRGLRIRRGYTREYLARAAGLDASHLWRIEQGQVLPKVETIHKLAGALTSCPERYHRTSMTADDLFEVLLRAFGEDARSRGLWKHPSVEALLRDGWVGDAANRADTDSD